MGTAGLPLLSGAFIVSCKFFEWLDAPSLPASGGSGNNSASGVSVVPVADVHVDTISRTEEGLFRADAVSLYVDARLIRGSPNLAGKFQKRNKVRFQVLCACIMIVCLWN